MCGWISSAVYVTAVGSSFRFDKQDIKIKNNLISFDKYNIYASGINPFVVDGTIDHSQSFPNDGKLETDSPRHATAECETQ